jgi:5-methylthioadenosine/S-adenosylhomocysteine deaminase
MFDAAGRHNGGLNLMDKRIVDLILTNGYVLTMDDRRTIYEKGAIAVRDGKIEAMGTNAAILGQYDAPQHDCQGGVVHPGLADVHEHAAWHLVRSIVPDTFTVPEVWEKYEDPIVKNIQAEDEKYSLMLATMEMAVNGTTIFGDTGSSRHMQSTFDGANIVGVKGYTSMGIGDDYTPELRIMQYSFARCIELFEEELKAHQRTRHTPVGALVGLPGMEHCSKELLVASKELAKKYGVQMQVHTSVYREEIAYFLKRYGKTPIELFEDLGILDEGTTLVHVIHISDYDLSILEKRRPSVVHCPGASFRYGLGAMHGRFKEMQERGINIALGTDAGNWCDGLDIFQQMYLAAVGHRECKLKYPEFTREDVFEMGTINGARALGVADECGSLEVGKAADIVIHSVLRPELLPASDRVMGLVYASQSRSVKDVLVDGEFIVRDGRTTRLRVEDFAPRVNERQRDMLQRMGYTLRGTWPVC